ncbi:MAG: MBL fold metallo-hydrolase, partial [Planctomycetaceae bacterium]|nr:MBL fold metallo-hydrolase [Planctomycetaceae bacterium]
MSIILEIHHINVGAGDSTLIIVRDKTKLRKKLETKKVVIPTDEYKWLQLCLDKANNIPLVGTVNQTVLIDAGNDQSTANKVNTYLKRMGVAKLDHIIASHYHQDHVGGLAVLLKDFTLTGFSAIYDRGDYRPPPAGENKAYLTYKRAALLNGRIRNKVDAKTNFEIDLGVGNKGRKIILKCVSSDGDFINSKSVKGDVRNGNDYGLSWLIQYGAFRYFTGGDLGGFSDLGGPKSKMSPYIKVETPLIQSIEGADVSKYRNGQKLNGHICAFKINHHGSHYSSDPRFFAGMRPSSAIISCGDKHQHPHALSISDIENKTWNVADSTADKNDYPPGVPKNGNGEVENTLQKYICTSLRKKFKVDDLRKNI